MILQDAHIHLQDIKTSFLESFLISEDQHTQYRLFCNATNPGDWQKVAELASSYVQVVPFFGVHPWYVENLSSCWREDLSAFVQNYDAGVGEIGLDRVHSAHTFSLQEEIFSQQLEICIELNRPVVVHCVKAWDRLLPLMQDYDVTKIKMMVHSFSSSVQILSELINNNIFVSFSWSQFQQNPKKFQELISCVDPRLLLLETDYPYGGCSAFTQTADAKEYHLCVQQLYDEVAMIKRISPQQLQEEVFNNGTIFANRITSG